jgi:hypothetical protein
MLKINGLILILNVNQIPYYIRRPLHFIKLINLIIINHI